jgi:hypothetical protein
VHNPERLKIMSYDEAIDVLLTVAVREWFSDTRQSELRQAIDIVGRYLETKRDQHGAAILAAWMAPDPGARQ